MDTAILILILFLFLAVKIDDVQNTCTNNLPRDFPCPTSYKYILKVISWRSEMKIAMLLTWHQVKRLQKQTRSFIRSLQNIYAIHGEHLKIAVAYDEHRRVKGSGLTLLTIQLRLTRDSACVVAPPYIHTLCIGLTSYNNASKLTENVNKHVCDRINLSIHTCKNLLCHQS